MPTSGKELKGSLKEGFGKLTGNDKLEAKGRADKLEGRTKRRARGFDNEVKGTAKQAAGTLTGNTELKYEGKAQAKAGRVQSE